MFLNGLGLNNGEKGSHQDYSTMKCQIPDGLDTEVTWMTKRRIYTLSLMRTKTNLLNSVWILLPQREEKSSKKNGMQHVKWFQSFYLRMISFSHTNTNSMFQTKLISEEFGNTTESTHSEPDSPF